jgi:hypothetical protein
MTSVVYKVSGLNTSQVYYGYAPAGRIAATFLAGCKRTEDRGDVRMLEANEGDVESLTFTPIEEFDEEFDAWCLRNDLRSIDSAAITGPTMFPVGCATRVTKEQPERLKNWSINQRIKSYANAREAYENEMYTFAQISAACKQFGKELIMNSLESLNPYEFASRFIS